MSPLLTVAIVRVSAEADEASAIASAPARSGANFMDVLPLAKASICFERGQLLTNG
jgi:hypothetical protein